MISKEDKAECERYVAETAEEEARKRNIPKQSPRNLSPLERFGVYSQGSKARLAAMVFAYLMNLDLLSRAAGSEARYTSALHDFMDAEDQLLKSVTHPEVK